MSENVNETNIDADKVEVTQEQPQPENGEQNKDYPNGDDVTTEDDYGSADG